MKNKAIIAGLCLTVAAMATGCKDSAETRKGEDFYVKGIHAAVERLKVQTHKDDVFVLRDACDSVAEILQGLPRRLEANKVDRLAEKKKLADDALNAYYDIEGGIRSRKMPPEESAAKLDEILAMVDKTVEP